MAASAFTRALIEQGLRPPATGEPLGDAYAALGEARVAVSCAIIEGPTPGQLSHIASAAGHVQSALHYLAAARVRQEGRS